MKKQHLNSFEFVDNKILNKISDKDKDRLFKYRRIRRDILKWEKEVENLRKKIKGKRDNINRYNEMLNHLFKEIEYLKSDYDPKIHIVSNLKKGITYWNLNIKYKSTTKPIYLGSDKKLRSIICKRNDVRINVSKSKFRDLLYYEFSDNIKDWVIENKDEIFNMKITLNELLD